MRIATVDKKLLDILVCPVSGAAVSLADADTLARMNERIDAGEARYVDESTVTESLDAALVTADRATAYRVDDGIPVMLPERGIDLSASA
ncbi:Trm112 family protein [Salinisphaera sp.]|uniref:Trm112 family protein n=1 Tax=Salinisphaera sp. TaxID=1914330 RepID=UPI0025EF36CD|nr:Trm112 family protein [Salinisphaera sp.]